MEIIILLEKNVWLTDGEGDPPRTTKIENALVFNTIKSAYDALQNAREYRPFLNAKMITKK